MNDQDLSKYRKDREKKPEAP